MSEDNFIGYLIQAINNIDQDYFKLKTTYSNAGIVRERVFCYELYHQVRLMISEKYNQFHIHGEIDKRGHDHFMRNEQRNPDFVFHVPGEMRRNFCVIEVKGKLSQDDMFKDFTTLTTFIDNYNYKQGVFILYNHSFDDLKHYLRYSVEALKNFNNGITILCKKDSGSELNVKRINELYC